MNDYEGFRSQMREAEIARIKRRKANQKQCIHARGGRLQYQHEENTAFCFLKLPTGEMIAICLYCQKTISSIDPQDAELFRKALAKAINIPESGQLLAKDESQLFGQLARFAPEERDRILKQTIWALKGNTLPKEPEAKPSIEMVSKGPFWEMTPKERYLQEISMEELADLAKNELKKNGLY